MAVLAHASYSYFSKRTHPTLSSKTTKTRKTIGKSLYVHASSGPAASYVPFANAEATDAVVVDCTHPTQPTFTHHKGHNNPPTIRPSDTSTGLVLNALEDAQNGYAAEHLARQSVTSNHFDADALFSSWAFINRAAALKHAEVLRAAAALHDFREVAGLAGPETLPTAALALCCWINVVERTRFSPPYEEKDADDKFAYFLEHLGPFLESPGAFGDVWRGECDAVMADWRLVEEEGSVHVYGDIGLAVVRCPQPVHYYALFSHSLGCDVVVSGAPDQRTPP